MTLYRNTPGASQQNAFCTPYVPGEPVKPTTKKSHADVSRNVLNKKRAANPAYGTIQGMGNPPVPIHLMRPTQRAGAISIEPRGGGDKRAAMRLTNI
jgi:hypothetical protein